MKPGDPFNPYRLFNGLFVPEALAQFSDVSPGAKLAYGRLARYAGQNGKCFPATDTLGAELGVSERQARRYVMELEKAGFIRRNPRFHGLGQASNEFEFLWHPVFESDRQGSEAGEGRTDTSGGRQTHASARGADRCVRGRESLKKVISGESHLEDNHDLDCLLTNRKNRDSQSGYGSPSICKQYPRLREALCRYMMSGPEDDRIYPRDRHLVDIMDAARGETEEAVIACLRYLYFERGLKQGTKNGPRSFAWFATVVQDYFSKREERLEVANPTRFAEWEDRNEAGSLSREQFDELTTALF
jgi:hypothetical protein